MPSSVCEYNSKCKHTHATHLDYQKSTAFVVHLILATTIDRSIGFGYANMVLCRYFSTAKASDSLWIESPACMPPRLYRIQSTVDAVAAAAATCWTN